MIEIFSKTPTGAVTRNIITAEDIKVHPNSWISLSNPTSQEIKSIADILEMKEGNLNDALDVHESPRIDHDLSNGYVYVRWPQANKDGSTTTHPLLLAYNSKIFLTVTSSKSDFVSNVLSSNDGNPPVDSPKNVLLSILEKTFMEYDIYIKGQSESIQRIITKMRRNKLESEDFIRFVLIEEQINSFLSSLGPVVPLLRRLCTTKYLVFNDDDHDTIEDIILSVEQSIHICSTNITRITSVREAYAALSNNSLNRTMKALTAATFFIALPNVIFGMYGMNISLPVQDSPWAFTLIISSALVSIMAIALLAKNKRWF